MPAVGAHRLEKERGFRRRIVSSRSIPDPADAQDYVFRFDASIEPLVFGDELNLSGWLIHHSGKPINGIRVIVKIDAFIDVRLDRITHCGLEMLFSQQLTRFDAALKEKLVTRDRDPGVDPHVEGDRPPRQPRALVPHAREHHESQRQRNEDHQVAVVGERPPYVRDEHVLPLHREQIAGAELVANPGCYPTATILALAPLARAGVIADVVVDAKSGVSGAGRAANDKTHFVTVDENVNAYGVPRHRHTPEIEQELAVLGNETMITFTPHLLPLDQGELVSCYVTLADPTVSTGELESLYHDAYDGEQFVELVREPAGVRAVRETNICRISFHRDERTGRAIVFGAIDNLWKGTASEAVQNLNLMFDLPEGAGIGA